MQPISLTLRSEFKALDVTSSSQQALQVAVPSRMCFAASPVRPLNGMRVAVKDVFDIKGMRTSLSSRAYLELQRPSEETAKAIRNLVEAGSLIIGSTKLCSLISKEDPTEAVDYSAPFNARADGYQSPNGSSSGSAAAIGAYDWLDVAIGTDSMPVVKGPWPQFHFYLLAHSKREL